MTTTMRPPAEETQRVAGVGAATASGVPTQRVGLRSLAFDQLAACGAILDDTGRVVDTNDAWRLFSDLNGGRSETTGIGVSYLEVCERAVGRGDREAAAALAGLREVLAGRRHRFEQEYACTGPEGDRWFRLSFTASTIANVAGVLVLHEDVTVRRIQHGERAPQADHDPLTGLSWRPLALQLLARALEDSDGAVVATSISVRGLDEVNRLLGRSVGDEVLVHISNRLRRICGEHGMLSRVGGARFLLVTHGGTGSDIQDRVAAIRSSLSHPVQVGVHPVLIGAAIGAASSIAGHTAEALVREAEARSEADALALVVATTDSLVGSEHLIRSWPRARQLPSTVGVPGPPSSMTAELLAVQATTNAVLAHATDLVLFFSSEGTIVWASPACKRLFGVEPEDLVGLNGLELIHADDRDRVFVDFSTIPDFGDSVRTEFRVTDAAGRVRWVEEVATNLLDEPDVAAVVGHLRDVTDRKVAESQVQFHARLLAAAGQAIVARDADGLVTYWNDAAEALYGWTGDEAIGRRLAELVPSADGWAEQADAAAAHFSRGRPWAGELQVVTRRRGVVPVRVTATPVPGDAEGRQATIIVSADMSEELESQATAARLAAVVESSTDAILSSDGDGIITTWNGSAARLFGHPAEVAIGMPVGELLPTEHAAVLGDAVRAVAAGRPVDTLAALAHGVDGTTFHASISLSPIAPARGQVAGVSMIVRDVTEAIERRMQAERDRQRLADAQASAGLGSFEIDLVTGTVQRSVELWRILGRDPSELDVPLLSCVHPDDHPVVGAAFETAMAGGEIEPITHRIVRPDGQVRWVLSKVSHSASGHDRLFGTSLDITERHLAKLALAHQATHDPLTGLANRRLFLESLEAALERDQRSGRNTAVIFIDLDDFKAVNDRIGHPGGDEILRSVGRRIEALLDPGETIARLGGDEFVICCEDLDRDDEVGRRVQRIQDALGLPFKAQEQTFTVTCSIGVALSGASSMADVLLRDADAAMYAAKQQGPGRVETFDQSMSDEAAHRRVLIAELEEALVTGQIHAWFQPEVELRTGQLIGFEALTRWLHPERGLISPCEFIPLAEASGLIHELGRRVLADSCAAMAAWSTQHPEHKLTVSVNVSPVQMAAPTLAGDVRAAIASAGVPAGRICLEVTESALMEPRHAAATLRNLKEIGVLIAIDDFGTGYSSLSRLKEFPVDFLKVDRTFVAGLGRDPEDELIVGAVADLAHSMGIQVIAEGIETSGQLAMLAEMGCEFGQGFLWSRAVAVDGTGALIDRSTAFEHVPAASAPITMGEGTWGLHANDVSDSVAFLVHELATPLTIAGGYASLLRESVGVGAEAELAAGLEVIARAVEDMGAITRSLAETRPIADGTVVLARQEIDVVPLLAELIQVLDIPAPASGPVLEGLPSALVFADPTRLRQVFRNLLTKAITWTTTGVRVHIDRDPAGRFVTVSVLDDGPGVPADRLGDLFRRFARLDPGRSGTGLGLYIARTLARAHGGEIRYHRTPEGGSEFAVELPEPSRTTPVESVTPRP